jgi:hypothetical protein
MTWAFGDGDNISGLMAPAIAAGDMVTAAYHSRAISTAIALLATRASGIPGFKVWFAGGDDIALEATDLEPEELEVHLQALSDLYFKVVGAELSWGIGASPQDAKEQLALAKLHKHRPIDYAGP